MKKNIGNILFYSSVFLLFFVLFCQMGFIPLRFIFLKSGSMRPVYEPGDLVFVYLNRDIQVSPGEIVLFSQQGEAVVHRVVEVDHGLITTKGDANDAADPSKIQKVDGKVLFGIPKLGYGIDFIQTTFQSIVQVFIKSPV